MFRVSRNFADRVLGACLVASSRIPLIGDIWRNTKTYRNIIIVDRSIEQGEPGVSYINYYFPGETVPAYQDYYVFTKNPPPRNEVEEDYENPKQRWISEEEFHSARPGFRFIKNIAAKKVVLDN